MSVTVNRAAWLARPALLPILPGVALTAAIAALAFGLRMLPGLGLFSPMIIAIALGTLLRNLGGLPAVARPGVVFSMRRVLRFAIILLGLQITAQQVAAVGATGLGIILVTMVATFLFTSWAGRALGVDAGLTQLIAAGTSICGASAVITTNTVTRASEEDAIYAVACVTVFGSIAMFVYPLLPSLLGLGAREYGLWSGASIHEIAQVVAASYQQGAEAGEAGTIAKLARVLMLAPMVMLLGALATRGASESRVPPPMPWFVLGFLAVAAVNSVVTMPEALRAGIVPITAFLLSMALAAMGLETDMRKLRAKGVRPLLLGLLASLFIAGGSLVLVKFAM